MPRITSALRSLRTRLLLWLGVNKQDLMPKAKDEAALARRP